MVNEARAEELSWMQRPSGHDKALAGPMARRAINQCKCETTERERLRLSPHMGQKNMLFSLYYDGQSAWPLGRTVTCWFASVSALQSPFGILSAAFPLVNIFYKWALCWRLVAAARCAAPYYAILYHAMPLGWVSLMRWCDAVLADPALRCDCDVM